MPIEISEWMADALCTGKSTTFFGPIDEKRVDRRARERLAIKICNACPVMHDCRLYARKNGELGVWGGETEEERYSGGFINDPWVSRNARARERRLAKQADSSRHNGVR
jgi:WhiB family transcriptional regulator, redox-sensing transcriptional regulator